MNKEIKNVSISQSHENRLTLQVINDTKVLVRDKKQMLIPKSLQMDVVKWYHHYLQHPGHDRLENTIKATMFWRGMRSQIRDYTRRCITCQRSKTRTRKYGKLPAKQAEVNPWETLCVDCIGPYSVKDQMGRIAEFRCVTMIDPATGWFEMEEIPTMDIVEKGIVLEQFDMSSAQLSRLVNKEWWLSRYPRPKKVVFDNGSEFKLHFQEVCDTYNLTKKAYHGEKSTSECHFRMAAWCFR